MKKIVVISELFYPNKTSTAFIMTEIARYLAKKNKVMAICSDIVYDANIEEKDNGYLGAVELIKAKAPKVDKNKTFSRLWGSLFTTLSFGKLVIQKVKKGDTVFAVTNPFLLVLTMALIRIFKNFDYVLLVHDVFPENAVPAGLTNPNGLVYKLSKRIYDWAYSKADRLIVLGRDMKELVDAKVKGEKESVVVENWFDEDLTFNNTVDRDQYLGIDTTNKIVIGFAGNIGRVQNLEEFLEVFSTVNTDRIILVLIGEGAKKEALEHIIQTKKLQNVLLLGNKPRSEQSTFLSCFDIGLITLSRGMYGLGVPSKTYNLLAFGKPVLYIGDQGSELDRLVTESSVGWSFNWEKPDEIRAFLSKLENLDGSFGQNAKTLAETHYSEEVILSKLERNILNEN
ncbi:glycosyltransferase family 4 protein [Sphingobacterium multivorum]|uniref:glycosyltransferase family 4 protein n=1 Tax=Sphingobacterium multivorum TaxID=28454 RepID=UPI0028B152E2|nr:glycosyltransferase family 4 protein [Sphingobacterium multivorum]